MPPEQAEAQQQPAAQPAPQPSGIAPGRRSEMLREMFGNDYHEAAPKPVSGEGEQPAPMTAEPEEGDTKPTEGDAPQVPEGEQPEGETAPEDTGETPIATLSELVEHLGTSPEFLNGLKVPVTVDGTPTETTLGDLVKSYQMTTAAEHRLEDAKATARKESEAWAQKHAELDMSFHVLAEMVKTEEANLEREINAIDPKLREQDPAEWAARVQEFNARRGQIDQIKQDTVNKYLTVKQQQVQQQQVLISQVTAEQAQLLQQALPEWQDPAKASAEKTRLASYALQSGFTPQELDGLIDHRQVLILRKAMLYDEGRGMVDTAKKKVVTVPKIMKPGAPKPAEQRATERLAALKARMEQTGSEADAYNYRMAKRGAR